MKTWQKMVISSLCCAFLLIACQQTNSEQSLNPPSEEIEDILGSDLSSQAVNAEGYIWRPLKVGAGGFITGSSMSKGGGNFIVRTDTYGLYRWSTRGDRWLQLLTDQRFDPKDVQPSLGKGVFEVAIAPSNPRRVYMSFNDQFYKSDTGGASWIRMSSQAQYREANDEFRTWGGKIAIDPKNADIVIVASSDDGPSFISRNAGRSFTQLSLPVGKVDYTEDGYSLGGAGVTAISFDPTGPVVNGRSTVIYASSYKNGVYISRNAGQNWQRIQGGPAYLKRAEISKQGVLFGAGVNELWRYKNANWTAMTPDQADWSEFVTVTVDPRNSSRLLAAQGSGQLHQSLDEGATWTALPYSITGEGDVPWIAWGDSGWLSMAELRFDPKQSNRVWGMMGAGVIFADLEPTAKQVTWQLQSRGIEQLVGNDVIAPPKGKPVVAAWDFGTFYIDNPNTYRAEQAVSKRFNSTWQLDYMGSNPQFMVGNTSDHRFCCSEDGLAIQAGYSEDGGQSWTRFPSMPKIAGQEDNPFAFGFGSIAVSATNPNNIVWAPTNNEQAYYTLNRGATWQAVVLPGLDSNLPLGSHFALYLSRSHLASDKTQANTFYFVHSGQWDDATQSLKNAGLYRTTNSGRTWQKVYAGELASYSFFNATLNSVPGKADHLFFTSGPLEGNPQSDFMRSSDGGRTWTAVANVKDVHGFGFGKAAVGSDYPTIFIVGYVKAEYGIYRSTDNALSWRKIATYPMGSMDQIVSVDGDKNIFGRVYVAFKGSGFAFGREAR